MGYDYLNDLPKQQKLHNYVSIKDFGPGVEEQMRVDPLTTVDNLQVLSGLMLREIRDQEEAELEKLFPDDLSLFEGREAGFHITVHKPLTMIHQLDETKFSVVEEVSFGYPFDRATIEDEIYNELIRRNCLG